MLGLRTFKNKIALLLLTFVGVAFALIVVYFTSTMVLVFTDSPALGFFTAVAVVCLWSWPFVANYREERELNSFYTKDD